MQTKNAGFLIAVCRSGSL